MTSDPVRHAFQTPVGEIWLWGEAGARASDKPVVLFINGAFAIARPRAFELPGLLTEASVLIAHLPGNHCPNTSAHAVAAYAEGFSSALDQIGRPALVIGGSVGALVGLSIPSTMVRGQVIIEPPLLTAKLWCLIPTLRSVLANRGDEPGVREFIWSVFGVSETRLEPRDYRGLLDNLTTPGCVMFGEQPLYPERAFQELPSLVDAPERALLAAHPLIETRVIPIVGHNVPGRAIQFVRTEARRLIQAWPPESGAGSLPGS